MKKRKRFIQHDQILVIYEDDLPEPPEYGYSIYKGVLVQWDEDQDTRVLDIIDDLHKLGHDNLVVIREESGLVSLLWNGPIPDEFQQDKLIILDGDEWNIEKSVSLTEELS